VTSIQFDVHVEQPDGTERTLRCGADWLGHGQNNVALWSDAATDEAVDAIGREAVEEAARDAFTRGRS